jgi:3-oxoacyl-[acyl-carrier-protein] synthase III
VRVAGTGVHEPALVVTSAELDERTGREPGTSQARSGVSSRRWAGPGESSSSMAASAVDAALRASGLGVDDLDALIVAMVAPEQPMPTTAVLTLRTLGAAGGRTEGFDVNSSCLGFLTGFEIAAMGLAVGRWQTVAVVATEMASLGLDHDQVEASALFGDGAAAAVLTRDDSSAVLGLRFGQWPASAGASLIAAGGTRWNVRRPPPSDRDYLFAMDGPALLRATARHLPRFLSALEEHTGFALPDADLVVPHQASAAGMRFVRERLGLAPERVVDIIADHGNQVSASLPTALHEAIRSGRLARGHRAVLLGSGAGLGLGAVAIRY